MRLEHGLHAKRVGEPQAEGRLAIGFGDAFVLRQANHPALGALKQMLVVALPIMFPANWQNSIVTLR